jgi:hypothetical protein
MQQTCTNDASKNKNIAHGQEGESNPIQNKSRIKKKSQHGPTQGPLRIEKKPRGATEQVSSEEVQTETQYIPMEEEVGHDTRMDTQIPEAYEPSYA